MFIIYTLNQSNQQLCLFIDETHLPGVTRDVMILKLQEAIVGEVIAI